MSFQLVIAEKPSVARSIAAVIGADEKQNGYWQGAVLSAIPIIIKKRKDGELPYRIVWGRELTSVRLGVNRL